MSPRQHAWLLRPERKPNASPAGSLTSCLPKEIFFFFSVLHLIPFLSGAFHTKSLKSQGMGGIFLFRNPFSGNYVKNVFILGIGKGGRGKKKA